ncbi:general transcription factor II-I repeat domain-containing protein 2B-like [Lytechinus variegatus]|uniref:general transcription factor II-I repeat domain-containing protein 2B-like n=1 Tax=Lytechinus variegatus TaxID=7654 RepID=UPI001BB241A2|nr:general transcription factor II-I repeat domain-containing protein 2B-like [Lytechinus variegatus]
MSKIAFLVDIFTHLNGLNLKLQGHGKSLAACKKTVKTFQGMLPVYLKDLTKDKKYFPTLKEYGPNAVVGADFVQKLMDEFNTRFADFKNLDSILLVVTQPFLVDPTDERCLELAAISPDMSLQDLQEQLIELQADDEQKLQFNGKEKKADVLKKEEFLNTATRVDEAMDESDATDEDMEDEASTSKKDVRKRVR